MGGLSFSSCSKDKGENLAGRRALSWGQCEGLLRVEDAPASQDQLVGEDAEG